MIIYAIANQKNEIYIGVSGSTQAGVNISNHLHGKCKGTCGHFSADAPDRPGIHLLTRSESDHPAQAILAAYSQFFQEHGYHILNKVPKHYDQVDAATILSNLNSESAEALLQRTQVERASALNPGYQKPEPLAKPADTSTALTIRLSESEHKRFADWAAKRNVTQRDALMMLITLSENGDEFLDWHACRYIGNLLSELRQQCDNLKKENKALRSALWKAENLSGAKTDRLMERARNTQAGVMTFFDLFESNCPTPLALESLPYADYKRIFSGKDRYTYPSEPGFRIFTVHAIVKPKHPSKSPFFFIIGSDPEGNRLKYRVYSKYYFTGISFKNSQFAYRHSSWVVGCEQASDGAMDAILAFPLEIQPKYEMPWFEASQWRRSLEDMLRTDAIHSLDPHRADR